MRLKRAGRFATLADGISGKVRIVLEVLIGRVLDGLFSDREIRIDLLGGLPPVPVVLASRYDLLVLEEVWLRREYEIKYASSDPQVIVDMGANVGFSAIFFARKFPTATIHAFEPDPNTYKRLRRNTDQFPNIQTHRVAISSNSGSVDLHRDAKRSASASLISREHLGDIVRVPCESLNSIIADLGRIDIFKFDIEGAEFEVFGAAGAEFLAQVSEFVGEVHFDLVSDAADEFFRSFTSIGFSVDRRPLKPGRELVHFVSRKI